MTRDEPRQRDLPDLKPVLAVRGQDQDLHLLRENSRPISMLHHLELK